jgi:hypothetical protein
MDPLSESLPMKTFVCKRLQSLQFVKSVFNDEFHHGLIPHFQPILLAMHNEDCVAPDDIRHLVSVTFRGDRFLRFLTDLFDFFRPDLQTVLLDSVLDSKIVRKDLLNFVDAKTESISDEQWPRLFQMVNDACFSKSEMRKNELLNYIAKWLPKGATERIRLQEI